MTDDDLTNAWSTVSKGTGSLWCHGVRKSAKQLASSGEESDIPDGQCIFPPTKIQFGTEVSFLDLCSKNLIPKS